MSTIIRKIGVSDRTITEIARLALQLPANHPLRDEVRLLANRYVRAERDERILEARRIANEAAGAQVAA